MSDAMQDRRVGFSDYSARHFRFETDADGRVATITLNRPAKNNQMNF